MRLKALAAADKKQAATFELKVTVMAGSDTEARDMQVALQSFISHFSVQEMKSAAQKLKNPLNRKLIKNFL